jgi:hypothetical protein
LWNDFSGLREKSHFQTGKRIPSMFDACVDKIVIVEPVPWKTSKVFIPAQRWLKVNRYSITAAGEGQYRLKPDSYYTGFVEVRYVLLQLKFGLSEIELTEVPV